MSQKNTTPISEPAKQRRSNKPLMEKRRRERINKSLNCLKELVLLAQQKDLSKFNKLEKADILEMTVNHVKTLHQNQDLTETSSEFISKYRSGFAKCTAEVESFLSGLPSLPPEMIHKLVSHLNDTVNTLPQEGSQQKSTKGEIRVKATIDTSILRADVVRHHLEDRSNISQAGSSYQENRNGEEAIDCESQSNGRFEPAWCPPTTSFPPSPPDSSRYSSSPDSLRGSPLVPWDSNVHQVIAPYQQLSNNDPHTFRQIKLEANSAENYKCLEQDNKPLNLTTSSSRQENSFPHPQKSLVYEATHPNHNDMLPGVLIKQESHIQPPSPPSGRFSPDPLRRQSGYALQLEAGPSHTHSLKVKGRPTPYPKKDAVKRYQTENPSTQNKLRQNIYNSSFHNTFSASHWRPW